VIKCFGSVKTSPSDFKDPKRMATTSSEEPPRMDAMFQTKYDEFAKDLVETFPELKEAVAAALALAPADRITSYRESVFKSTRTMTSKDLQKCPGTVLPGVTIPAEIWETTGKRTKVAVIEYLSVLNLCVAFTGTDEGTDAAGESFTKEWAERLMREARASMSKIDFDNISESFFKAFGANGEGIPPLPEKFLKGKLAKLAEEMVREFNPEDFGIKPEDIAACESDPTRAFELLMGASMKDPTVIQKAMMRVAKRLQDKVARGELKPQELVAEAEELIQEFQSHPAFVELMKSFKDAFNVDEDMDTARAAGRDGEGRLAQAKARLRKKMEAKKAAAAAKK